MQIDKENINRQTTMDDEFLKYQKEVDGKIKELEITATRSVPDINSMYAIPMELRREGIMCYVQNQEKTYQLKGGIDNENWTDDLNSGQGSSSGGGSGSGSGVHIDPNEPQDKSVLWVDTDDEDLENIFNDFEVTDALKTFLKELNDKVEKCSYAIEKEIDSGYFGGHYPGYDGTEELPEGAPVVKFGGPEGSVKSIRLKRGYKKDIQPLKEGELGFCIDSEELYVGNKGLLRLLAKVGGTGGSGGGGVSTSEYVELIAPNKKKYRLRVNEEGKLFIRPAEAETIADATIEDTGRFKGLQVYQIYGAGSAAGVGSVPVSHSFIQLYNNTNNELNLKGLSIQYAGYQEDWKVLPLTGVIPPFTSFLIRCKKHVDPTVQSLRIKVTNHDMEWDQEISEHGKKVLLCVGTAPCNYVNPFDIDGIKTKAPGYIDMLAAGGKNSIRMIDGYETSYLHCTDKYTGVFRTDFNDKDNNANDCEPIDYRTADIEVYHPRGLSDGQWDVYFDKMKMDPMIPNLINMGFGKDGNRSRTFTWQSVRTKKGALRYKLKGEIDWIVVESEKVLIQHYDVDAISHSVILRNLEEGTYVYQVGEEGRWSDEAEFVIKVPDERAPMRFVHISDQQGWNEYEYKSWEKANAYIEANEDYDFIINTGDMTQNANRSYEWRYYYEMARRNLQSHPHMMVCGNNDLVDKKDPIAFTYYATYEDSIHPSVYSFNYGYVHFICLNSNIISGYTEIQPQIDFIRDDMTKPENQKRWVIVLMHEAPYQIVRTKRIEPFINVFYEVGVDLVLCGHHHCYTRSHRVGPMTEDGRDTLDPENGVYYVMCQATGFKNSGKTVPTPDDQAIWRAHYTKPGDPCYILWDITWDTITMHPYRVANIHPPEANLNTIPYKIPFDTELVITNKRRS